LKICSLLLLQKTPDLDIKLKIMNLHLGLFLNLLYLACWPDILVG
jgi:hypothetical protein